MTLNHTTLRLLLAAALGLAVHAMPGVAFAADPKPTNTAQPAKPRPAKSPAAKKPVVAPAVDPGPAAASPEQLSAAEQVFYGSHACEFNQTADVAINPKHAGYVDVKQGKSTYLMKPVLSSTGAIRLEDMRGQTLMVQIASKSMLLDVKAGRRIVDECVSAKHHEAMERHKMAKLAEAAASAEFAAAAAASGAAVPPTLSTPALLMASPSAAKAIEPVLPVAASGAPSVAAGSALPVAVAASGSAPAPAADGNAIVQPALAAKPSEPVPVAAGSAAPAGPAAVAE